MTPLGSITAMKKLTAWAKAHKIAATLIAAGAAIVLGLAGITTLGAILIATGNVPEETVAATQQPEPTAPPTPKPTPTTAAPAPTTEAPAPATTKAAKPTPTANPLVKRLEDTEADLDAWFEDCTWDNTTVNSAGENTAMAMGACESEGVAVIVGEDDSIVQATLDEIGKDYPTGAYILEDGVAVWSPNRGTVNLAWDALGTPGTPTAF